MISSNPFKPYKPRSLAREATGLWGAALPDSVVYAIALPVYGRKVLLLDNSQGGSLGKAFSEPNQTDISSGNSLLWFTSVKLSFKFKTQKFHLSVVKSN